MPLITLETEHPVAIDSPDHIAPAGTVVDNRTDEDYVNAIKDYFDPVSYTHLPLPTICSV